MPPKKQTPSRPFLLPALLAGILIISVFIGTFPVTNRPVKVIAKLGSSGPEIKEQTPLPELSAKAIYAIDLGSGKVLAAKSENQPVLPASTTKIVTALVALSHYKPDDILKVGKVEIVGQKMGLKEGEEMSFENLIYGLLVFSGNDAAETLAENYPGGRDSFIAAMNRFAELEGLENTHFTNPTGLDEYLHFSSAQDLVKIATKALENPTFARVVSTKNFQAASADGQLKHDLTNINELVGKLPGILGIKTGWTEVSGESLVTLYEHDGHKVVLALLGSKDRFGETEEVLTWVFKTYSWE